MAIITFLSRMKVFPDKEQQFIDCCKKLEAGVQGREPDTLLYKFYRLEEPLHYAVLESFTSHDAEEVHLASYTFKAVVPDLIPCLDGGYIREYLYPLEEK
jgi:quinol monooxygenase YgiN